MTARPTPVAGAVPEPRFRLTLLACLAVAAALVVGALVVLSVLERTLVENLDDAALVRAEDVAAELESGGAGQPLLVHGDEDAFIQVIDGEEIVTASSNLRGVGRIARFEPGRQRSGVPHRTDPRPRRDGRFLQDRRRAG